MTDLLLQIGASKLLLSLALAGGAWFLERARARPQEANLAWLLVLATLLVPAVFAVPVEVISRMGASAPPTGLVALSLDGGQGGGPSGAWPFTREQAKLALLLIWLAGSATVIAWSLAAAWRFDRLARKASAPATPDLQRLANELAKRLNLSFVPDIHTTGAHVSPMVWWTGGRVRILVPGDLLEGESRADIRWILAHELAHVRRWDHLVRWIEWLACAAFWWNPVAWWAGRRLKSSGEECCDALVMATFRPPPRTYAASLVNVIDFLSRPRALRAPIFANEAYWGGTRPIQRRIETIMRDRSRTATPRWIRGALAVLAVCVLPLGLVYCGPADAPPTAEATPEGYDPRADLVPEPIPLDESAEYPIQERATRDTDDGLPNDSDVDEEGPAEIEGQVDMDDVPGDQLHETPIAEPQVRLREVELRLRQAVESGEITPEQAEAEMVEVRQRVRLVDLDDTSEREIADLAPNYPELPDELLRAVEVGARLAEERARLHAQIDADQLTEDQAGQLYEEVLKELLGGLVGGER